MIIFGYAKSYKFDADGTLWVQVRIPSIHGPYLQSERKTPSAYPYVPDKDLPYYMSLVLPTLPNDGDVVAISSMDDTANKMIVIGLTGATYKAGFVITS